MLWRRRIFGTLWEHDAMPTRRAQLGVAIVCLLGVGAVGGRVAVSKCTGLFNMTIWFRTPVVYLRKKFCIRISFWTVVDGVRACVAR
jgi:hypothetical protein